MSCLTFVWLASAWTGFWSIHLSPSFARTNSPFSPFVMLILSRSSGPLSVGRSAEERGCVPTWASFFCWK